MRLVLELPEGKRIDQTSDVKFDFIEYQDDQMVLWQSNDDEGAREVAIVSTNDSFDLTTDVEFVEPDGQPLRKVTCRRVTIFAT
jgi:hypothetical protein